MTALPTLQAAWMARVLDGPLPEERRATCRSCALLAAPDDAPGQLTVAPELKCCTYQPVLANFAVGRILDGVAGPGRDAVERRARDGGEGVTPAGISPSDRILAALSSPRFAFGRDRALRCPYLDDAGGCGIWHEREAVCTTFFCKHEHGARSLAFWRWLRLLLQVVERALAGWAAARLGARGDDWGDFTDRRLDFYRRAAALVTPLGWDEVAAIGGPQVGALTDEVRAAQRRVAAGASCGELGPGAHVVLREGPDTTRVVGYWSTDPIDVPNPVLAALDRPETLDAAWLERLCDQEILVPASALVRRGGA
jgi:hypothetical protein